MTRSDARTHSADHPPSTSGTPPWRARRWPVRAGIVAVAGLALAAPMVAADPANDPEPTGTVGDALASEIARAVPASAISEAAPDGSVFADNVRYSMVLAAGGVDAPEVSEPAPPPTTEAPTTTTEAPAPPPTEAPAPAAAGGSVWDRLAECEADGNWQISTGNGYYGGLQFSESSWQAVGGSGLPHQASRETQIAMGERLKAEQGWGAWPACSQKLGLR
ncbi:hypothetical protein BH23ACT2_BH23ACT2_17490 [soil metagenome]